MFPPILYDAPRRKNEDPLSFSRIVGQESRQVRVMVSSAQVELKDVRSVLRSSLRLAGFEPKLFEGEGALDESVENTADNLVKGCDVYVLVLGTKRSEPTLKEFRLAERLRKPILVYVRGGDWPGREDLLKEFLGEKREKYVYDTFRDAAELVEKILPAVSRAVVRELGRRARRSSLVLERVQKEATQLLAGSRLYRLAKNGVLPVQISRVTRLGNQTVLLLETSATAVLVPGLKLDVYRVTGQGKAFAGTLEVLDVRAQSYSVGKFVPTGASAAWWEGFTSELKENQARELDGQSFLRLSQEERYQDPEAFFALSALEIKKEYGL